LKTSFSPKRAYRSRGTVGESPKRASTDIRRQVRALPRRSSRPAAGY